MAQYPGIDGERRITAGALEAAVADIFGGCGMRERDGGLLANSLVAADLRGIHSHGVMRVPDYVHKLLDLGVDPVGVPRVKHDRSAALVIDGANTMGQVGAVFAMDQAIERARSVNVAVAALGASNHCGAMDYYVRRALPNDMIGIAATNALPTMAPWGGVEKVVGLNPVAMAFPAGTEAPVILDVALGATAHGKIEIYHQKGEAIPPDWAFDVAGNPTTDAGAALDGLIQPVGAFKGIGLALCMGLLSTLLSGAAYGTESGNMIDGPVPGVDGQIFMAINIAGFEDPAVFRQRMDRIIREFRNSERAQGVDALHLPGALEAQCEQRYAVAGIPLNNITLRGLDDAAARAGVSLDL